MKNIYAILPCFNEEDNIGNLIEEWNKQSEKLKKNEYELKIVAIDDYSTDSTKDRILEKKQKYSNVEIIEHEENKGLSGGLNSAIHYFNKNGKAGDLLVLMDGDNTHAPKYIHEMLEQILNGNDCVIASRYREGSNVVGLSKNRELMSNFAKIYYSAILNIPNVKDYTCGYRVYTYDIINKLLEKFGENPIKEKSFACMMELLYKIYLVGAKFEEVGFELRYDNKCGKSKMNVLKTAERSLITAIKLKAKYTKKSSIICLGILILFAIFLSLGTNFSPTSNNVLDIGHDAGIFSYIGFAMQNGRRLYAEAWENKGPLLYLIYYIGLCVNENYGIYLFELISIFISVLFGYKTIKLITDNKIYSIIGIIYTFSVWGVTYEFGTLSENFALPLLFIGIYFFTKEIYKKQRASNLEITIWGILVALIALLRLNILAIFLGFFIVIGIDFLLRKEFKEILRWLGFGTLGVIIGITPVFIYLIANNILIDCLNTAYFGIMSGFDTGSFLDKITNLIEMIQEFDAQSQAFMVLVLTIEITIILVKYKKINKREQILYLFGLILAFIINLYANSVTGAYQMHYFMTFIPLLPMAISICINLIDKIKIEYKNKVIILGILVCILSANGYKVYIDFCIETNKKSGYTVGDNITNYIIKNTEDNDLVQMIGGRIASNAAYFGSKRLAASKYSYLPLWDTFTRERKNVMTNELVEELYENKPKLIFIYTESQDEEEFYELINDKETWEKFLEENYVEDDTMIEDDYKIFVRK